MSTVPITVHLPKTTINSIRTLVARKSLSIDDMATLSSHASTASKAVIEAVKLDKTILPTSPPPQPKPTHPELYNPEFFIFICNVKTGKCFPLKVQETTLNREVAEMVEKHEGIPLKGVVLRDRKGKLVYGWDEKAKGSPVKMKQLLQDGVEEGDLLTVGLNEEVL